MCQRDSSRLHTFPLLSPQPLMPAQEIEEVGCADKSGHDADSYLQRRADNSSKGIAKHQEDTSGQYAGW